MNLEPILQTGAVLALLLWGGLAVYVLHIERRRAEARGTIATLLATLRSADVQSASVAARVAHVTPFFERVSRDMILHTAADAGTSRDSFDVLATYLVDRWGVYTLIREASSHRMSRDIWRRSASLKVLFRLDHPEIHALLQRAVADDSSDVASVGLTLLGMSTDPRSTGILIAALKSGRHAPSRVAVHLEHSPLRPAHAYLPLLEDQDPVVRFWGANLLGEFPELDWVETALAPLVNDGDARVRKAAIQSLGKVGDAIAASAALRMLRDPAPFVRAHAARALGELDRAEDATAVAELLGDPDWWVRAAAKQSLETMGSEVWPVLMRCLDNPDEFVRNGAAEVFQNLGILDSLIVMEAASDDPSGSKIDLLRRIVSAGGMRLTDSLVERAGAAAAPRVRRLLATMGLEQVGAA